MKASDYLFGLAIDADDDNNVYFTCVVIVPKAGFDPKDPVIPDDHVGEQIKDFWPTGIVMDEIGESTFAIEDGLTEQELRDEFLNAGFEHSQELEEFIQDDL